MTSSIYFIHAITPLHAGIGQAAGDIDLPIARERATRLPYLPGSSLKGALRARSDETVVQKLFGPNTANASDHAGSVQFSDARLLFFPVRSLYGIFAYVTSPFLIRRFLRDAKDAATAQVTLPIEDEPGPGECLVSSSSVLRHQSGPVWLEDLRLQAARPISADRFDSVARAIEIPDLAKRVCIVSDDALSFFVETATEVTARIRLDSERLTVEQGGLWYEEALPAESVLTGLVQTRSLRKGEQDIISAKTAFDKLRVLIDGQKVVQLGGKATVGRGVCRVFVERGAE